MPSFAEDPATLKHPRDPFEHARLFEEAGALLDAVSVLEGHVRTLQDTAEETGHGLTGDEREAVAAAHDYVAQLYLGIAVDLRADKTVPGAVESHGTMSSWQVNPTGGPKRCGGTRLWKWKRKKTSPNQ